ncbi:MAG: hypothetical protein WA056_02305 [Gallionella sp.]
MHYSKQQQQGLVLPIVLGLMALVLSVSTAYLRDTQIEMKVGLSEQRKDFSDGLSQTALGYVKNRLLSSSTTVKDLNGNGQSDLSEGALSVQDLVDWEEDDEPDLPYAFLNTDQHNKPLQNYERLRLGLEGTASCTPEYQDLSECDVLRIDALFQSEFKPLMFVNGADGLTRVTTTWANTNTEQKVAVFWDYSLHPYDNEKVNVHLVSVSQVGKAISVNWVYLGYYKVVGYDDGDPVMGFFKGNRFDNGLHRIEEHHDDD